MVAARREEEVKGFVSFAVVFSIAYSLERSGQMGILLYSYIVGRWTYCFAAIRAKPPVADFFSRLIVCVVCTTFHPPQKDSPKNFSVAVCSQTVISLRSKCH